MRRPPTQLVLTGLSCGGHGLRSSGPSAGPAPRASSQQSLGLSGTRLPPEHPSQPWARGARGCAWSRAFHLPGSSGGAPGGVLCGLLEAKVSGCRAGVAPSTGRWPVQQSPWEGQGAARGDRARVHPPRWPRLGEAGREGGGPRSAPGTGKLRFRSTSRGPRALGQHVASQCGSEPRGRAVVLPGETGGHTQPQSARRPRAEGLREHGALGVKKEGPSRGPKSEQGLPSALGEVGGTGQCPPHKDLAVFQPRQPAPRGEARSPPPGQGRSPALSGAGSGAAFPGFLPLPLFLPL